MRRARMIAFALIALWLGGAVWSFAGSLEPGRGAPPVVLASYTQDALLGIGGQADAAAANMSAWIKTVQARCPPGQLVFLTNACGCNGACCACSAPEPYLDHCSCRCSATPPTTCNRGFSAGRR